MNTNIRKYLSLSLLISVFLTTRNVSGQNEFLGLETRGVINIWLEILILVLFSVILIQNYVLDRRMGSSIISVPFIYITIGLIVMGFSRILFVLNEFLLYGTIPRMVMGIWWHLFFYLGIIVFYLAIRKVESRTKEHDLRKFSTRDVVISIFVLIVSLGIFFTPSSLGPNVMQAVMGTFVTEWGLIHFIAFLLIFLLTAKLLLVQTADTKLGKYLESLTPAFLGFLALLTLNHLIALLANTWSLIPIDAETVVMIEQILWTLAFGIMIFGYTRLLKQVSLTVKIEEEGPLEYDNPNAKIVLNVLSDHIGSLATQISIKSANDSGIDMSELNENNVSTFAEAVEKNTINLIGEFPSKFLNQTIQKSVKNS